MVGTDTQIQSIALTFKNKFSKMRFISAMSITLALFASTSTSLPRISIEAATKHNLFLITCPYKANVPPGSSPSLGYYTAAAYYADGSPGSSAMSNVTGVGLVSYPYQGWAGRNYTTHVETGRNIISISITADAPKLSKGQVVGSAKVDSEDFECLVDGSTTIIIGRDQGFDNSTCTADYWCQSLLTL